MLRDLLFVFQGIDGKHIKYDEGSERFKVNDKVKGVFLCASEAQLDVLLEDGSF